MSVTTLVDGCKNNACRSGQERHPGHDGASRVGCFPPAHHDGAGKIAWRRRTGEEDRTPAILEQQLKKIGREPIWTFRPTHDHEITVSGMKHQAPACVIAL